MPHHLMHATVVDKGRQSGVGAALCRRTLKKATESFRLRERASVHCHLVKYFMQNSMYKVFTICFHTGDANHKHILAVSLGKCDSRNSGSDLERGFLCTTSAQPQRLYTTASFALCCSDAAVAAKDH